MRQRPHRFAVIAVTAAFLAAAFALPAGAAVPPVAHESLTKAQTPPSATGAPASPAQSFNRSLSVAAGTGVLLYLPQPAATVMSADPDIARVQPASPTSMFLMGVAPGRTTVIATSRTGEAIVQYDVTVGAGSGGQKAASAAPTSGGAAPAATAIDAATASAAQGAIARSVTGGQEVRVHAAGKDLVLSGTIPTAMAAQQAEAVARAYAGDKGGVLDHMLVLGDIQVNVRVRIAEISRSITRQLGFNWQALGNGNGWSFGLRTGAGVLSKFITPLAPLGLTALSGAPLPNQLGAGFTSGNKLWDVNSIIDALAADQLITILAEPNLTAQSGETASFLAGGEFPIPVAGNSSNNTTTITVEFKQFGVSLSVVPTVLSPTRLNLRVRPEVSELSNNGAVSVPLAGGTLTIPALTVRRAETTVELGSGQSFAIAGLLQRTSVNATNALPGIGELPVLGALFKSNDFQRGESELVIIVTPYIVHAASSPSALRAPTDNFRPATDLDRVLFGRQMAPDPSGKTIDAGFILK